MWLNLHTYDIDDVHETAHGLDVDVAEVVVGEGHLGDVLGLGNRYGHYQV